RLLINELAPRPHNSGHWSIDGSFTSQFEQQCRVLAGLPLGDVSQHTPAVMVNLLGDVWYDPGATQTLRDPDWGAVLADPRAKLHLYGKQEARRGRKMGHVTCLGSGINEALEAAARVKRVLGIPDS
ncbi:MAG: ATP-grasp domain-containing protein, partial [Acidobacteriota bacterium]